MPQFSAAIDIRGHMANGRFWELVAGGSARFEVVKNDEISLVTASNA